MRTIKITHEYTKAAYKDQYFMVPEKINDQDIINIISLCDTVYCLMPDIGNTTETFGENHAITILPKVYGFEHINKDHVNSENNHIPEYDIYWISEFNKPSTTISEFTPETLKERYSLPELFIAMMEIRIQEAPEGTVTEEHEEMLKQFQTELHDHPSWNSDYLEEELTPLGLMEQVAT